MLCPPSYPTTKPYVPTGLVCRLTAHTPSTRCITQFPLRGAHPVSIKHQNSTKVERAFQLTCQTHVPQKVIVTKT